MFRPSDFKSAVVHLGEADFTPSSIYIFQSSKAGAIMDKRPPTRDSKAQVAPTSVSNDAHYSLVSLSHHRDRERDKRLNISPKNRLSAF